MTKIQAPLSSSISALTEAAAPQGQNQKLPIPKAHQAHVHNAPLTNLYISPELFVKEGYISAQGTIAKMDAEKMWLKFDEGTLVVEKFLHGMKEEVGSKLYLYILKEQFEDLRSALARKNDAAENSALHHKLEAFKSIKDAPFMQKLHQFFPRLSENFAPGLYSLLTLARKNAGNPQDLAKNMLDPMRAARLNEKHMMALLDILTPTQGRGFTTQMCPLYDGNHYQVMMVHYLPPEKSPESSHKHFEFNLKNTPVGMVFIEGLYDGLNLHFKIKTELPLEEKAQRDLKLIYADVLQTYHLKGSLKFEIHHPNPQGDSHFSPLNIHL